MAAPNNDVDKLALREGQQSDLGHVLVLFNFDDSKRATAAVRMDDCWSERVRRHVATGREIVVIENAKEMWSRIARQLFKSIRQRVTDVTQLNLHSIAKPPAFCNTLTKFDFAVPRKVLALETQSRRKRRQRGRILKWKGVF